MDRSAHFMPERVSHASWASQFDQGNYVEPPKKGNYWFTADSIKPVAIAFLVAQTFAVIWNECLVGRCRTFQVAENAMTGSVS
jgi:hypothetical protein